MGGGLYEGIQMANALFAPMRENLESKRAMKRRMAELQFQHDLQRQTKEQDAQDIAANLLPVLNQGRGEQPIPEFNTKFGMKSAAYQDASGNPIDPNKLQNGLSKIPIKNLRGETTEYDAEGIRQALAKMNSVPMEAPETKQMYSDLLNAQKQLETGDLSGLQAYKPKEGLPLYTQEQLAGLQRAGLLDNVVQKSLETQTLLDQAKQAGLSPEEIKQLTKAKIGGSTYLGLEKLPIYQENVESMIENRQNNQDYRQQKLGLDQEYKAKVLQLRAQGLSQQQAHQLAMEDIARERLGQGAERIQQGYMPVYSSTTENPDGSKTTVRQKGGQPTQGRKLPPPTFNYNPTINRK